jgi:hypothetical protein
MNKRTVLDRIRGTDKPYAETGKGWNEWKKAAKEAHPFRYWLVEVAFEKIGDAIQWPSNKLYGIKYYVVNRWIDQSHALVAHPKHIKPGKWQDLDYRILHCNFDELVDFVEIEKAYSNYRWDAAKLKQLKWWQGGRWRTRTWRNAEAGLNQLKWESELSEKETNISHIEAAKEIMFLYDWWVNVRPTRPDPMDASGWSEHCEKYRSDNDLFGVLNDDSKFDARAMLNIMTDMENRYFEEDTEMLVRLIKVRGYLWT